MTRDPAGRPLTAASLLLSPTRTYAPLLNQLFDDQFENLHGIIHCSGGGQTKCLKYLPKSMRIVKDNLFTPPPVFEMIREAANADLKEMYQVFNMGHRLEVFVPAHATDAVMRAASGFGIESRIVGRVENSAKKELELTAGGEKIHFSEIL
ncbi:MAG TPA: AIR synthase-related protein [Flavitalea sp.]|nr:AIR synthase-related protein [Flavitalea sp.]